MKFVAHNEDSQEEEDSILILGADDVKHELSGARGGCINCSIALLGTTMTQPRIRLCTYCVVVSLLHITSWNAPIYTNSSFTGSSSRSF